MDIIFKKSKWEILLGGARDKARQGAAAVSRKAEDARLAARLRRRVKDLEEEIDLQLAEAGALIYATHTGTPSSSSDMQEILSYIDGLYEEIEGHERQLKILQGVRFCEGCGQENAPENAFCQACGKSLKSGND